MNYHSDEWIMDRVKEHYQEALEYFPKHNIVGIFYQGSGNYGVDYEKSDVDTKLIVTPSFEDIVFNRKAESTTHIRANDEHIDFKDIRLMFGTFRKQNLNFLEILFTKYCILNPDYALDWNKLIAENEKIAHYNLFQAIKSMKGIAMEKRHALQHPYPSKLKILSEFGYDPKQLHHLLRVEEYIERYINGEKYADCLISKHPEYLIAVKSGYYPCNDAVRVADASLANIVKMTDDFCSTIDKNKTDKSVDILLDSVQESVMRKSVTKELL